MQSLLRKIFEKIKKAPYDTKAYEDLYYMCREALRTNRSLGVTCLKKLSNQIENQIIHFDEYDMNYEMIMTIVINAVVAIEISVTGWSRF